MVIMIMEYHENQIDDDGYEQDDSADNLKMIEREIILLDITLCMAFMLNFHM